ncbi:ribonuclease H-like protein [Yamadazyma tenuis ATCC 10573]|uniref:poly(A)-specific ribonuclease n=2 Tax=Candida tenuis TaxID=2315449 RepID=G3AZI7_CANTC|nr:ribonuclease H-like protein [Yamadazyma tenuis ATCC 10573]EGV65588.1 ribonuclease H-like protein [Yamadazyma tenuis ATCC 10573]
MQQMQQMQQLHQLQQQPQQQPQAPYQQQQQFQNQIHPIQQLQQLQAHAPIPQPTHQVPIIREVWSNNLEHEFHALRAFANDKVNSVYISIHQEIPGIVSRPVGSFKSQADYHFQTLRSNADLLNLIQLSLCVVKVNKNNEFSNSIIWQFNFLYDISKEMFNEEHLSMLAQNSQINFQLAMTEGIHHFNFAELMLESGLLLDKTIHWVSFHGGYDLGYFVSLLKNDALPINEEDFHWYCNKYFPNFIDLKLIGSQLLNKSSTPDGKASKPSIEYLAEELHLLPISPVVRQFFSSTSNNQSNQQLTSTLHAYLIMECFKELLRQSGFDFILFSKFSGLIWGLNMGENGPSVGNGSGPSTPGTTVKSGVVHFGRPF